MKRSEWSDRSSAPHGKLFYGAMVFFCAVGALFFGYVAIGNPTESSGVWRIAFGARTPLYILGMLQALERLTAPERAARRSAELSEGKRLGVLIGRWITLAVSLGGFLASTLAGWLVEQDWKDVCDDLRLLTLSLLLLCFCLADLVGETTFSQAMWTNAWQKGAKDGLGGLAKRKVSWHSLKQSGR